jgi:uncharacterized protein YcgI (DUF1989 family)
LNSLLKSVGSLSETQLTEDLLAALSTCPAGSLELPLWGANKATDEELKGVCHPLKVEVWDVGDKTLLKDWKPSERASYSGFHGLIH